MTAICGGGASGLIPGRANSIVIDSLYARSLLPDEWEWIFPFLVYNDLITVGDMATFCSTDPPTVSMPTGADFLNFVQNGKLGLGLVAYEYIKTVIREHLWYAACQCTVGGPVPPPTGPTPPTGLPVINPSDTVTLPQTEACATEQFTSILLCGGNNAGITFGLPLDGRNVTAVRATITDYNYSGANFPATFIMRWTNYATVVRSDSFLLPPVGTGSTRTIMLPAPPDGAISGQLTATGTGSGCRQFDCFVEYFCNGEQPGGVQGACCPPDPQLAGMVQQILVAVNLLQRQVAPFAYVPGTSHGSLTGSGELSVAGLIGAKITITDSNVFDIGVVDGDPEYLYTSSWFNWGSSDGWAPRQFLTATTTLTLPSSAGAYTKLAYSLAPGIEVTIVELVREP